MDRWLGKVALVTGASSGIGAATALKLANKGFKVVAIARRVERIQALATQVTGPGRIDAHRADFLKEEEIYETFDYIKATYGTIHVLVNNAGVDRPGKSLDTDPKLIREIFDLNVLAVMFATRRAADLMRDTGVDDGHIILLSSVVGHEVYLFDGEVMTGAYAASKHAITALRDVFRHELRNRKSKIKVSTVTPGYVNTEFVEAGLRAQGVSTSGFGEMANSIPALQPSDVADTIWYALDTPAHVQIHEIIVKPAGEHL